MEKPVVFLSHSSKDRRSLSRLREMLIEKTGDTIDFFLSSDGQSIKLGHNWVHRIEEALQTAKIMFVFITPNSIGSSWMLFESGFEYSKRIRVIPTGFLGMDIAALSPPLSILQGFNIGSSDGLDNLIAILNEEFSYNHAARFTGSEFQELLTEGGLLGISPLGQYTPFIDNIRIRIRQGFKIHIDKIIEEAIDFFKESKVEFEHSLNHIQTFGLVMRVDPGPNRYLEIELDSSLVSVTFPILETLLKKIREEGVEGIMMEFRFNSLIWCEERGFKLSAKLYGLPISFGSEGKLGYGDFEFKVDSLHVLGATTVLGGGVHEGATLGVTFKVNNLSIDSLRHLIELLFERGVLFIWRGST
ncbi:MAG TPA: toll/interleukin-1 receptor domain-containing protein [Thermodesulfobacteriota bacterium]|nr:toll/interleukin-1 receptor domain-containing protein [Thermodesulfobacteriota bacterium]